MSIHDVLAESDTYCALAACNSLIMTGPTGTNVNDVSVALILPQSKKMFEMQH